MKEIALSTGATIKLYTPTELKEHLDKYVIGQDKAKRVLCTAVYNHYKRLYLNGQTSLETKIDKSNILLQGSTGSGKTFMIKTLAEFMGVPYYIGDATSLTQAGYVGDDVETLIQGLLRQTNFDKELAETGIVFIDEIDKLARRSVTENINRKDPVGEGVQQALLKIVEGSKVGVSLMNLRKNPQEPLMYVDTTNILFVGSGSFAGIEDVVKNRLNVASKIGFNMSSKDSQENAATEIKDDEIFDYVCQEDIRNFGFIPEFCGRFPIITNVKPLSKEDLVKIIREPKDNILDQYATLFSFDDIELSIEDEAINYIAEVAVKLKTGARALRSLFEDIMEDYMFELPGTGTHELLITEDYVRNRIDKRYKNLNND